MPPVARDTDDQGRFAKQSRFPQGRAPILGPWPDTAPAVAPVAEFQFAWIRALALAGGPDGRPVTAAEVARALPSVERVVGRVTAQGAAANLGALARVGLVEAVWEERTKLWRVTAAGIATLAGSIDLPDGPEAPVGAAEQESLRVSRLAELIGAYNRGDLALIDDLIDSEVLVFVPGLSALAGTYSGHGAVIALLHETAGYFRPDVEVLEGAESEGETRIRVRARVDTRAGGTEQLELWIRARFAPGGRILQAVFQPEHQEAFDRAIGKPTAQDEEPAGS
jgi:hypothetical protein